MKCRITRRGLPAQARPALQAAKGSSKTAKLARLLLARDADAPGAGEREAVALAIEARLERASFSRGQIS